jgi:hypothetical protein
VCRACSVQRAEEVCNRASPSSMAAEEKLAEARRFSSRARPRGRFGRRQVSLGRLAAATRVGQSPSRSQRNRVCAVGPGCNSTAIR